METVRRSILPACLLILASVTVQAATLVGNTPGTFSVSASGNAIYQIPLTLPPGTAGMTPELGLVYSSGAGDGEAGWGWRLRGFPSIRRCPARYATNDRIDAIAYDNTDRLCLDGDQLMLFSGSYLAAGAVYRPEIDNFTRVTQIGSGTTAYFKVELKNGRVSYFGSTPDARALNDAGSAVREWAVNRIEDRSTYGNYIAFSYSRDPGGQLLPEYVSYTGSDANAPYHGVNLIYETRPAGEARATYRAGSEAGYTRRLDRIDIGYAGAVVHRYELTYESSLSPLTQRSRLASVQECGAGATDCYRPVTFEWLNASDAHGTGITGWSKRARWADFNGDGLDDAVFHGGIAPDPYPDPKGIFEDEYIHLSLDVRSLPESVAFYTRALQATVVHHDASGYVNLDVCGCQVTLKENADAMPLDSVHLGINLDLAAFDALAADLLMDGKINVVMPPRIVDAGTQLERRKMYLRCPTGYLVEIKSRRQDTAPIGRSELA